MPLVDPVTMPGRIHRRLRCGRSSTRSCRLRRPVVPAGPVGVMACSSLVLGSISPPSAANRPHAYDDRSRSTYDQKRDISITSIYPRINRHQRSSGDGGFAMAARRPGDVAGPGRMDRETDSAVGGVPGGSLQVTEKPATARLAEVGVAAVADAARAGARSARAQRDWARTPDCSARRSWLACRPGAARKQRGDPHRDRP